MLMSSELKDMIRQLLQEELSKLGKTNDVTVEQVRINTDQELKDFIFYLIEKSQQSDFFEKIKSGDIKFVLAKSININSDSLKENRKNDFKTSIYLELKLITEKVIDKLESNIREIEIPINATITPLAKDTLRKKQIKVIRREKC